MKKEEEKAYLRVYRQLKQAIVSGVYKEGERLPGKRVLSDQEGVSLITIEHALRILQEEGYVESRQRSGSFVIYRADDFYGTQDEEPLPSWHEVPFRKEVFPQSAYNQTLRRVLADDPGFLLRKPEGQGLIELRQELVRYLARSRGMHVTMDQIVIGSGAEYLYALIVQLLGRDRIYAIEAPSYEKIAKIYEANGVTIERLPMGRDGIVSEALKNAKASVLHITPYDSYPSGVTALAGKRQEYVRWAMERGGYLVEDDYESEFTISSKPVDTLFSMEPEHSVIYINTFNRTISPSLRVGYMILPHDMVDEFQKKAGFYACTVSTLSQLVIARLLSSGAFERHINRVRRERRKNQKVPESSEATFPAAAGSETGRRGH